jgi:hypothetical protein
MMNSEEYRSNLETIVLQFHLVQLESWNQYARAGKTAYSRLSHGMLKKISAREGCKIN